MNPIDDINAITKAFSGDGYSPNVLNPVPTPHSMPGYQVIRELGRGAMGVVYLASQEGLNRSVALKMVLSGVHASEVEKSRFLAEAEALAAIRHPGVVQVYDFGTQDGRPFFALEYLPGGSLAQRLNGTPLPAQQTATILSKLALAIQAAHDSAVIHRDLKPANVLFDQLDEPKITDFGLARRGDSDSGLTQTGAVLGTPSYMSPEQAEGRKSVGQAADVYSLGAILYECLTGRPPFRAATILETIQQVRDQEPLAPAKLNPSVPRDLETICLKCLSKAPSKRYPSAAELSADLERYQRNEPIQARPISFVDRGRHWLKRNPMFGAIAGLVLGGIGLVIGLQASANARLHTERDNARNAEQVATEQRALSQARLRKAVEAIDKMLVRVSSERWATRPELQSERSQVLEDAVAFYAGLTDEDSKDILVRKESAAAYTRLAGTYLLANELAKSEVAVEKAILLYEGLQKEDAKDASYPGSLSELLTMRGNISAIRAKFDDAIKDYAQAVSLAHSAADLEPNEVLYKLRQFQALDGQCYFYMISDPRKGRELHEQSGANLRAMLAVPQPSYEVQLAEAEWKNLSGAFLVRDNKFKEAEDIFKDIIRQLEVLNKQPSPSARVADRMTMTRSSVYTRLGICQMMVSREPKILEEAVNSLERGLKLCNSLLTVQPMAFPFQAQKITALGNLAVANRLLKRSEASRRNLEELKQLESLMMQHNTTLFWIRTMSRASRIFELHDRVKQGEIQNILADVDDVLSDDTKMPTPPELVYNCACVLAIACQSMEKPEQKTKSQKRAVELIQLAGNRGFFKTDENRKLLASDPDLDSLRQMDEFIQFKP
jgi:serine/threonine protein kinase